MRALVVHVSVDNAIVGIGQQEGRNRGSPTSSQEHHAQQKPLSVQLSHKASASMGSGVESGALRSLQVYRRLRHEMVLAGFEDGTIRVIFSNGTEYNSSSSVDRPPVNAMVVSTAQFLGQYVAVSAGAAIGFFDLKTMEMHKSQCENVNADEIISALKYDAVHPQVLYAATEKGNILVARLHADRKSFRCRVLRRIPDEGPQRKSSGDKSLTTADENQSKANESTPALPADNQQAIESEGEIATSSQPPKTIEEGGLPLQLAPVKGHLLAASPKALIVCNTTSLQRQGGKVEFKRPHAQVLDSIGPHIQCCQ
eukprot:SAG31_NODE_465_length_15313_cov_10.762390_2_plen_312_part_00